MGVAEILWRNRAEGTTTAGRAAAAAAEKENAAGARRREEEAAAAVGRARERSERRNMVWWMGDGGWGGSEQEQESAGTPRERGVVCLRLTALDKCGRERRRARPSVQKKGARAFILLATSAHHPEPSSFSSLRDDPA